MKLVIVGQGYNKYLFKVFADATIKAGELLVCDTVRGEQQGIALCDSFDADDRAYTEILKDFGTNENRMKFVTGKVRYDYFTLDKAYATDNNAGCKNAEARTFKELKIFEAEKILKKIGCGAVRCKECELEFEGNRCFKNGFIGRLRSELLKHKLISTMDFLNPECEEILKEN